MTERKTSGRCTMRKIFVLPVLTLLLTGIEVLAASTAGTFASTADQASLPSSAEQTLTQRANSFMIGVQRAENFSGVVLIARNGKVLFARPYGMANIEFDVPNTLDTKFRLASITKQFTAAAILILQERGKLSVSDTLCSYLPDCPTTWKRITIHQLLTHSSGIYSFTESSDIARYDPLPMPALDTVALFKGKPLDFAPGTGFHYSDSGYLLLGYIVERASWKYGDRRDVHLILLLANWGQSRLSRLSPVFPGFSDKLFCSS